MKKKLMIGIVAALAVALLVATVLLVRPPKQRSSGPVLNKPCDPIPPCDPRMDRPCLMPQDPCPPLMQQ